MIDINDESFPKVRRNLMIMSCIMLFCALYGKSIKNFNILGNEILISEHVMRAMVFLVWFYAFVYYYQLTRVVGDDRFTKLIANGKSNLINNYIIKRAKDAAIGKGKYDSLNHLGPDESMPGLLKYEAIVIVNGDIYNKKPIPFGIHESEFKKHCSISLWSVLRPALTNSTYIIERPFPFFMAAISFAAFLGVPIFRHFWP